jgi:phenylpyruvate tautomerase PptA (4-oxalocrotonate tautomerase family)
MPILDVTIVLGPGETLPADLAQRLADAAGHVFAAPPGRVWVTLHAEPADHYAENATARADTPRPVLVRLTQAVPAEASARAAQATALTQALAAALDRDSSLVHLIYEPPAAGRIAFGGRLRS